MANSNRSFHFAGSGNSPLGQTFETLPNKPAVNCVRQPCEFSFHTGSATHPEPTSFSSPRCSEKGCVFPAASPESMKCAYHELQFEEPALFRSQQPSQLLLDAAHCTAGDSEDYDEGRKRDRRRMAKQWEEFLKDSSG